MKIYEIRNSENDAVYVGATRNTLVQRWAGHRFDAKHRTTPLYNDMRKLGIDKFRIESVAEFETEEAMYAAEIDRIAFYRNQGVKCYNISKGGEHYYPIKDPEAHKAKLREKRKGRKPALGMKHSEENKKVFSMYGKARWDLYGRYPEDVTAIRFRDAHRIYGISKTHYYRLLKANASERTFANRAAQSANLLTPPLASTPDTLPTTSEQCEQMSKTL